MQKKCLSKKYSLIVAIDPDVIHNGVTELYTEDRRLHCYSLSFPVLVDFLKNYQTKSQNGLNLVVVVEAGWLNKKSNWHKGYFNKSKNEYVKNSEAVNELNANKTGRNHEVGRIIVQMCHHYGIEVVEMIPLPKIWKGAGKKITHEEIKSFIHNVPKQTNQENRDSILLAWNFAGYPIKIKSKIN